MKYILVTGGVYSGIGKGVVTSSIAKLLQWCGIRVTAIKIDPYINIDAGTFSPFEHGEVFVLDDGSEVDLDLGNYERFLDIKLTKDNNLTTGKIYQSIINRERAGDYLGKTVQTIPHITDAIQEWVERVAQIPVTKDRKCPEVCVIELGGTIGDIDSKVYLYAFREFALKNRKDFCCVLVTVLHQLKASGEWKTKTTQNSFRDLRFSAFDPDILFCRSETVFEDDIKAKIASSCGIDIANVIGLPDVSPIYKVPCELEKQNIVEFLANRLDLNISDELFASSLKSWKTLLHKMDNNLNKLVRIALVGKYTKLTDSYASLLKAIEHACIAVDHTPEILFIEASHLEGPVKQTDPIKYYDSWQKLCTASGIIIPGGFGERGFEGMIEACHWARENKKPFLGICLGFQTAVVEFARSILKKPNANSIEIDATTTDPVVIEMPEHHTGRMGGTLRLGLRQVQFNRDSILKKLYNKDIFEERHRHRYEANSSYVPALEEHGLHFVASDVQKGNFSVLELADHPFYIGTQFHPEYLSRPLKPSPVFLGFIAACIHKLDDHQHQHSYGYSNGDHHEDSNLLCDKDEN